jgi:hypothetical protein
MNVSSQSGSTSRRGTVVPFDAAKIRPKVVSVMADLRNYLADVVKAKAVGVPVADLEEHYTTVLADLQSIHDAYLAPAPGQHV